MAAVQATIPQITPKTASSPWRIIEQTMTNALNSCVIFDLFDEAIANILCLKTCTHGTSPRNYYNIIKIGVDPKYGETGTNAYLKAMGINPNDDLMTKCASDDSGWNCKNRFFVYLPKASAMRKYFSLWSYSYQSCLGENTSHQYNKYHARCITHALFLSCCTPTLKFRLAPNNPIKFTLDDATPPGDIAAYTKQPMSANLIGLHGSLHEGVNRQWLGRVKQNPKQFGRGMLMLAGAIALVALAVLAAWFSPFCATVLAIYGIIKGMQILTQIVVPLHYQFKAKPLPASA